MSVYVDEIVWRGYGPRCMRDGSCHLWADTPEELHAFAEKIGLRRGWFQNHHRLPHYDLTPRRRNIALLAGAKAVSLKAYLRGLTAQGEGAGKEPHMIEPPWGIATDTCCMSCGLYMDTTGHSDNRRTAALESTVEAMARALEGAEVLVHEAKPALTFAALHGFGATSRQAAEGQARVDAIRAALASWRALTGKEGERG